jgi:hypothetical protein
LIVEGLVFRVVTDSHPGDPALAQFGCPRTEYLLSPEPIAWTGSRDKAHRFLTHMEAERFAHPNRWHAVVADATKASFVPERLRPLATEAITELRERPLRKSPRAKRKARAVVPPVVSQRLWWKEKEAYG